MPPAVDSAAPDVFQMELSFLDVLNSPISLPSHVARFFPGLFPNLTALICYYRSTQWAQVATLLADVPREE
jgi:hypothetical protein